MYAVPAFDCVVSAITYPFHVDPDHFSESEVVLEEIMEDDAVGETCAITPPFAPEDGESRSASTRE